MSTYLVLHGYIQSSDIIRKKLKGFFGQDVNLIIPNAPIKIESQEVDDRYGWFPLDKIDLATAKTVTTDEDILRVLNNYDFSSTKIDGIIAFSQGCLAAALLLGANKVKTNKLLLFSPIPCPLNWKYTIPNSIDCKLYYGVADTLVIPKHSLAFVPALGNNHIETIEHRWGHVIPSTKQYKAEYNKFLKTNLI